MGLSVRRAVDVAVASTALTVLAMPMLFIATATSLTTSRNVIFNQDRYGLHGKIFALKTQADVLLAEPTADLFWRPALRPQFADNPAT